MTLAVGAQNDKDRELPGELVATLRPQEDSLVELFSEVKGDRLELALDKVRQDSLQGVFDAAKYNAIMKRLNRAYGDSLQEHRLNSNAVAIRNLVATLKTTNSYQYPFDSLKKYISILNAPDNSFRIFTWAIPLANQTYRYFGAIQMNSAELQLVGLQDGSGSMDSPELKDNVPPDQWFGALYYNITLQTVGTKKLYMLFGWDGNNNQSTKKLVNVMVFDEAGKPSFGLPIFQPIDPGVCSRTRSNCGAA